MPRRNYDIRAGRRRPREMDGAALKRLAQELARLNTYRRPTTNRRDHT
jgi:hypothetical protein